MDNEQLRASVRDNLWITDTDASFAAFEAHSPEDQLIQILGS